MLNVTAQNFTLDGGTSANNGIGIAGVTNLTLQNLEVKNMGGDGIDSSYNNTFTMTNVKWTTPGVAASTTISIAEATITSR